MRWTPALFALSLLALLLRIPFIDAPLTADEGGYAEIARLWERGHALYRDLWIDRPQGLILVFRGLLDLGLGSPAALRAAAAVIGVLLVLVAIGIGIRAGGTIPGFVTGLLVATFGASPFLEAFTLSGELISALFAALSIGLFLRYLRRDRLGTLALAGVLTGFAVLVKQSGFDAGLAIAAFLLLSKGKEAGRALGLFFLAAASPILVAALSSGAVSAWWQGVVAYHAQHDSLLTGSAAYRLHLFAQSLPAVAKGLGPLVVLAAFGWRRASRLARLWLCAAGVGVLTGGGFHAHYYQQLVVPLALVAGCAFAASPVRRPAGARRAWVATFAAVAVGVGLAVPLWSSTDSAQAQLIWPHDRHLQHDGALARYLKRVTRPTERIGVLWAAADVYYLADRAPALRYLWLRNLQTIPGALAEARRALARRHLALVAVVQPPAAADPTGATQAILTADYRLVATIDGTPVYRPRERGLPPPP